MLDKIQQAYEEMRAYFTLPDAIIARDWCGGCVYRTEKNEACAIGCRIPDEWINARGTTLVNDAGSIDGLFYSFPEVEQFIGAPQSKLYYFHAEAQQAHDSSSNAAVFIEKLDEIAAYHGLTLVQDQVEARQLVTA